VGQVGQRQPSCSPSHLKLLELLLGSGSLGHFEDVEPHGLAERSALSDSDDVSNGDVSAETKQIHQQLVGVHLFKTKPITMQPCWSRRCKEKLHQCLPKAVIVRAS